MVIIILTCYRWVQIACVFKKYALSNYSKRQPNVSFYYMFQRVLSIFIIILRKGPGMIWAIFGPHLEIHQLLFFSRLIFILSLKMKNGYVPTCYLEVIAISDFIHFPLSRRQFVGVGIYLAKSFHIK